MAIDMSDYALLYEKYLIVERSIADELTNRQNLRDALMAVEARIYALQVDSRKMSIALRGKAENAYTELMNDG